MNVCSIWLFAQFWMYFIILIFGNVPDILLQHYSRSQLWLPSEKCEVSSLGLEFPGVGLGFYDKVSVSFRNLGQVSVSEARVYARGSLGLTLPLELDISQKLYYKANA